MTGHLNPAQIPYASEVGLTVRFSDVDLMRVVHHAVYLQFFETMRFSFLRSHLGIDIGNFFSSQIVCPVIECQVKYLRPITFGRQPVGYTRLWLLRNSSFAFDYWVAEGPEIYARGRTRHCFATADLELLLQPPEFFSEAIKTARERHPGLILDVAALEELR